MNPENLDENYSNDQTVEDASDYPVDKKLADLMMKGWVMLADTCPVETCGCPLMKSPDGNKYCCGCEMWHFEKERPKKQRFGEIAVKNKPANNPSNQGLQVKHQEVSKLPKTHIEFNFTLNNNVLQSLQMKLAYLSNLLNNENNIAKSKEVLECIKLCIENIQSAKSLNL